MPSSQINVATTPAATSNTDHATSPMFGISCGSEEFLEARKISFVAIALSMLVLFVVFYCFITVRRQFLRANSSQAQQSAPSTSEPSSVSTVSGNYNFFIQNQSDYTPDSQALNHFGLVQPPSYLSVYPSLVETETRPNTNLAPPAYVLSQNDTGASGDLPPSYDASRSHVMLAAPSRMATQLP